MSRWTSGVMQYSRWAAGLLVCIGAGALSAVLVTSSPGQTSAAYYYYCPGGGSGGVYGYCPPTTTTTPANAAPKCGPITAPLSPVAVNTTITATAPFSDPNPQDTHTASMDWGDGTSSAATVTEANGSGTATATHAYTAAGVYTLTLTVRDNKGATGTCTFQYVVVFDPNAGFVTGGGWFNSPPGAYVPDPTASGKATFGFVSKYQKGATVPSGNTEFQFHAGNLNFKSTSFDWLVIAGKKAMFKGTGTINGSGEYTFRVWAIDGNPDRFRIQIRNKATNVIVYDNEMGGGDNADPTTALGGGSIVIHS